MKVLSTDGLTKLIQLIKSSFIKTTDTVTTNEVTLATVATSGSFNDLTNQPTIDTEISTSSTNAVQNKAIPNYIVSRGENLVTNGFASLGNNYNFKSFTFDGSDTYGAGGCFSYTSTAAGSRGSLLSNEYMPIDITQSYKLSYAVKNSTSTSTYDYINMYDIDKNLISRGNVEFVQGTTTTLAQDLKDGDTKVYLTNISSSWHTGAPGTSGANYYRGLIFWNYTNSFGYQYPIEYYSRNWWYDLWNDDNDVDAVNGVITLKSAWNHGTFPAGTSVSQSTTSGGNVYGNANYIPPMGEWTEKSFIFTPDRFRNGTSYITLGWLYNYSQRPSNIFKISSISLTQNLSIKDALTSESYATSSVGGVVKVGSTYGTNINNGFVTTFRASNSDIDAKTHQYRVIVPYNLDYAVKTSLTTNTISLTDAEKQTAQQWLGVNDKADTDLANLADAGNIKTVHNIIPNGRFYSYTPGATDAEYTMVADGWLYADASATANTGSYLSIDIFDTNDARWGTWAGHNFTGSGTYQPLSVPVFKNQKIRIRYNNCTIYSIRLCYTFGSESEAN